VRRAAATGILAALALAAGGYATTPPTTVQRTIVDRDGGLEAGPGEPHLVRTELSAAAPGRETSRTPLLQLVQLTDLHVTDEESPARVEFLDRYGDQFGGAYRPQEGLVPHVVEQAVRGLRTARSPLTGRRPDLVMATGDNVDNTQLNETRLFIDLLDGGADVDPDSGLPATCGTRRGGGRYDGVRGAGRYWNPDRPGAADGPGYGRLRDVPGVLEEMNRPFRAAGLGLPWYSVIGNHDALLQGTVPRNALFATLAVGCRKVVGLSSGARQEIESLLAGGVTASERAQIANAALGDITRTLVSPSPPPGLLVRVPKDARRRLLTKTEYMREHFRTRGVPLGHGFTEDDLARGEGNYAVRPKPGVRLLVLDTVAETGSPDGNLNDAQFRWLHSELTAAETARELVLVFAHQSLRTLDQPGPPGGPSVHLGGAGAPCPTLAAAAEPMPGEPLRCLLLRHRSVLALLVGHEHRNRVEPHRRPGGGGFWEVVTASHVDWPQQSRLVELMDNHDGTLSIFLTMLDQTAPLRAAEVPPPGSSRLTAAGVSRLAAIAREVAWGDPQERALRARTGDRRGTALDRNVELLLPSSSPAGSSG
jgi:metallophosphoesterase (TIGR03767 family)